MEDKKNDKKIILKRKAYNKMQQWKSEHAPDYALFIKGARRTGKTTLAEELGKNEYKSFITVNFQEANDDIKNLFVNGLMDLDLFFSTLELVYKTKLYPGSSLIILDEIQLFPEARQALKTLLVDKRFHYIETGSLAGIVKKSQKKSILIPSEEEDLEIYPLDFEEFLWAIGDEITFPVIQEHNRTLTPFGQAAFRQMMNLFRTYMCVGGMPQSVIAYVKNKDYSASDFAKRAILKLYRNDTKEQHDTNAGYVGNLFDNIPSELSKHDKEFVLTHINESARLSRYNESIGWLEDAMIVNIARNVTEPSAALSLSMDSLRFKMYMGDTGLLINLAFDDGTYLDNEYYRCILMDKLHINEGMFIENMVAQCLRANGHKIRYHSKVDKKSKRTVREVDFIVRNGMKIIPIEVKSSDHKSLKSLIDFRTVYSNIVGCGIVLHNGDIKKDGEIIYLPYFMASVI